MMNSYRFGRRSEEMKKVKSIVHSCDIKFTEDLDGQEVEFGFKLESYMMVIVYECLRNH